MKRLSGLIQGLLPFFAAILLQYSLITLLDIALRETLPLHGWEAITLYDIGVLSALLCGLFFFFWYKSTMHYPRLVIPRQVVGLRSILLLIGLGITTQFAISGMLSLLQPIFRQLFSNYMQVVGSILNHRLPMVLLYVVLIAPITEELIFRGVMLEKLKADLPFYGANLIQAAAFGIYHWNIIQGIYAFSIGLLLGYVRRSFRSLTASVLLHMAINGAAFLVVLLPNSTASFVLSAVLGLLVSVLLCYLVYRRNEQNSCDE